VRAACEVGLLVMREVSLVGVSQAEAGYNSNSNSNSNSGEIECIQ
jgi:hypothetical protein